MIIIQTHFLGEGSAMHTAASVLYVVREKQRNREVAKTVEVAETAEMAEIDGNGGN